MLGFPRPSLLEHRLATTGLRRPPRGLSWPALVALAAVIVAGSAGARGQSPSAAVSAAVASSTVVSTFPANADARVHEASPTTNYGSSAVLRVDGANDPDIESYLRFAVSGLVGSVQRATLRLYATGATVDGPTVFGTTNEWTETGIAWSNRPGPTTAAVDDEGAIATGSWMELDVTSLVTADGAFSFVVAPMSSDGVEFHSRSSTSATLRARARGRGAHKRRTRLHVAADDLGSRAGRPDAQRRSGNVEREPADRLRPPVAAVRRLRCGL